VPLNDPLLQRARQPVGLSGYVERMALTACVDVSPARWIVTSELPWQQLVGFGPAGFGAYARLRFVSDPTREGQAEADAEVINGEAQQLRTLFDVLAQHTRSPHDCYFCVWDGSGGIVEHGFSVPANDIDAVPDRDPHAQPAPVPEQALPPPLPGPRVDVPNRSYYLFQGALSEAGDWTTPAGWPAPALPRHHQHCVRLARRPCLVCGQRRRPALGWDRCQRCRCRSARRRPAARCGPGRAQR